MPIPKLIVAAALMAAQVAIGMTRKTQGPRLDSLKTTTAEYGTPINRFWGKRKFECPLIFAEDLREEKKTSKGKAGKNTEYKYYATFALLVCDHEIDAVTRIWMDDKPVYDVTKAGPPTIASLFGGSSIPDAPVNVSHRNMRVYLGTEDQDADPRMEAWCEDRYGPDSCPAYRGSAYIVFEDLPVNNFGNRIPNCTVEAVSAKSNAYPYETFARDLDLTGARFSPDRTRLVLAGAGRFNVWDVASRTMIVNTVPPLPFSIAGSDGMGVTSDGSVYLASTFPSHGVFLVSPDGNSATAVATGFSYSPKGCAYVGGIVCLYPYADASAVALYLAGEEVLSISPGFIASHYLEDSDGAAWACGYIDGEDKIGFCTIPGGIAHVIDSPATGPAAAMDNGRGQFVAWQGAKLLLIDKATWTVTDSIDTLGFTGAFREVLNFFSNVSPGAGSIWIDNREHNTADLSILRTADLSLWKDESSNASVYDPINNALICAPLDPTKVLTWRYLDRVASDGVTLQTIADDVSDWCGLADPDTSQLTQVVLGYSVTQGSGKDMLAPLLDIYDVDCRPHDFGIQFLNRGGAPSGSIATADFVREGDATRYTVTIQQDTDLPREISVKFADSDHDQQINTTIASRPLDATDSKRTEEIDLSTFVDTADAMQQKTERFFRRVWNSRERIKLSLTAQHLAIEPGDVTTPSLDGLARNARLDKLTIRGSVLDCEFVRDETSFATLSNSTGAAIEGSDGDTITIPSPTKGFALDIPLSEDADADINPLIYIAAGPYTTSWPGALAYENDNLVASIDSDAKATWGYADALATANPNLWDRGNTLDVTIYGTLSSSTEAAIDADPNINLCAVGDNGRWELLNFATATLTGTSGTANTYTLSGFKRGRRGTEANVGNHASGDAIVLLNMAHIVELGTSDVGTDLSFKIQTIGRDVESAAAIDVAFAGNTLKPYAPARIKWTTDGTDMFGEIIRRTRVGGAWVGGTTIPLSENAEAYSVDVMDGNTVLRTIAVTGNTFTYTAAQISADGNTVGVPPSVNAYQISDAVGRGFALAA